MHDRVDETSEVEAAEPAGREANRSAAPGGLLALQGAAGNRVVNRLVGEAHAPPPGDDTVTWRPVGGANPTPANGRISRSLAEPADRAGGHGSADAAAGSKMGLAADAAPAAQVARTPGSPKIQRNWLSDAADWVGDTVTGAAEAVGDTVSWAADRVGDALDIRSNEAVLDYQEDRQALREWRALGVRGPRNLQAPTGIGGFGAAYDPSPEQMMIRLAGGVIFTDSISFNGGLAVVNHPSPGALTQFVAQVNRLPEAEREAAAAPYMWTDAEKTNFVRTFNTSVATAWTDQHEFHTTQENWTDLGATVDVESAIHDGAKADDEHVSLTVYKTPPGGAGNVGVVNSFTGQPTNSTMTLNSPDASARQDNLLDFNGQFPAGNDALDNAGEAWLNQIAATYRGGGPACSICGITILASTGGALLTFQVQGATEEDARARYDNMIQVMGSAGNLDAAVRSEFEYAGNGDGYTVVAGNGVAQVVAVHEAGHMFGLGDEYATGAGSMITGTGAAAGGEARHDALVREMGLEGAVFENNDGIMSLGTVVRPQHYATFHWAIQELTGLDWALGPPVPVTPPSGAQLGDFPEPAPDADTAIV